MEGFNNVDQTANYLALAFLVFRFSRDFSKELSNIVLQFTHRAIFCIFLVFLCYQQMSVLSPNVRLAN